MKAVRRSGNIRKDIPPEVLEATVAACRKRYGHYPNVIGIGAGLKVTKGQVLFNKDEEIDTTICMHFYVRHKVQDLPSGSRLPRFVYARTAEDTVDRTWRIPTDVVNVGSPRFAQKSGTAIFPTGKSGAITIVFQNRAGSRRSSYLVTCAHIVGDLMQSPPVDPLICDQSGAHLATTIANSTAVQGAVTYDIALARLFINCAPEDNLGIEGTTTKISGFLSHSQIRPGLQVDCAFPVSNVLRATVVSDRITLPIVLDGLACHVSNLFLINHAAQKGDSGGLLYSEELAVGILVAMSDEGWGLFHPLKEAFEHLQHISPIPIQCF
jgi:hypothetical protein